MAVRRIVIMSLIPEYICSSLNVKAVHFIINIINDDYRNIMVCAVRLLVVVIRKLRL